MGGPIDTRRNANEVTEFATKHSVSWFETWVIDQVPLRYPGRGRRDPS